MFKLNTLAGAVALALCIPSIAVAEFEVSGVAKAEIGLFTNKGTVTGASKSHDAFDAAKTETSLKLFINSDVGEDSSFHAEVLLSSEGEAASDRLEGGEDGSQYEVLREFYFDTAMSGWDLRLGKQQVVWGTADGMKLLDLINPTDYRELNQNAAEDSRIPVWMINAEKELDNGANIQVIVSQAKSNFIAGLGTDDDSGAPFIFKGVDSITGNRNGFLNVAPALSKVANSFTLAAAGGGFDTDGDGNGNPQGIGLAGFTNLTVHGFAGNPQIKFNADGSMILAGGTNSGATILHTFAQTPENYNGVASNGNNDVTNLVDLTYDPTAANSAFEFMPNATFATFNTFAGSFNGAAGNSGFSSEYVKTKQDSDVNLGFRYKASTDSGVNYSVNYSYNYDTNPAVNMSWHDAQTGEKLTVQRVTQTNSAAPPNGFVNDLTTNVAEADVPNQITVDGSGNATNSVTVLVHNANNEYYGQYSPDGAAAVAANDMVLRFTEEAQRVNNIGGSFDMALDSFSIPTVLRGEFLYASGVEVAVIDKRLLAIGDLANSLKTESTDFFKYVLGLDFTVMTNMLMSTQLIQMYNLDYIDEQRTCTTQMGASFDCSKYTGDPSTLSMTNGLNKGDEVETFVSFFLSKPFGNDGQHRWNNIVIAENGGGYWNRFDVEYGFTDELVGTVELNKYWGDENTTFGQFEMSSNLQVGVKYLF
ncbi:MAG: RNA polymerase-associated protein rapA [Gammaproteobacteria bacterium]|nr:RNA polymerase-associated protein rapA [Gammaproteobacteria bacterium]